MRDLDPPPDSIRVVPLTRTLAAHLRDRARTSLTGDARCSLHNMRTSCFASERCAGRTHDALIPPMELDELTSAHVAYAAVDADRNDAFVGCVTASPAAAYRHRFPAHAMDGDALILFNLCVADDYRKRGVGHRLVARVLAHSAPQTYLLVARTGLDRADFPEVQQVFRERIARLRDTYAHMHFLPVCETHDCILMRYDSTHAL